MFPTDSLPNLPSPWKQLIIKCIKECLSGYKETLAEDEVKIASGKLTKRQMFAHHVKIGQKKLLYQYLKLLGDKSEER